MKKQGKKKIGSSGKRSQLLKVVYISSPMKVQASASEFRSIVQQLTGRDSNVARFMDEHQSDNDEKENSSATATKVSHGHDERSPAIDVSGSYYSLHNQNDWLLSDDDDHMGKFLFDLDNMLSGEPSSLEVFPFGFHESSFLDVFN